MKLRDRSFLRLEAGGGGTDSEDEAWGLLVREVLEKLEWESKS